MARSKTMNPSGELETGSSGSNLAVMGLMRVEGMALPGKGALVVGSISWRLSPEKLPPTCAGVSTKAVLPVEMLLIQVPW